MSPFVEESYFADEAALRAAAEDFARRRGDAFRVIYLEGDLGAGKTTWARGFLRGLGHAGPVKSPTYTLVEPYEIPGRGTAHHLDLYRIADPAELEFLGLDELLGAGTAWCLVEWPERGAGMLPAADLHVRLALEGSGRRVRLEAASGRPVTP